MQIGIRGCKLLFLGSVASASLLSGTALAARSTESGSHAATTSHITREASSNASTSDHDTGSRRGGGSKTSHSGGFKSGALANESMGPWSLQGGSLNASFALGHSGFSSGFGKNAKARIYTGAYRGGGVLQCVTFARADSGIEITGNATNWWDNAAGRYARGNTPESGSVLNFRSTGHMPLGHVSVVSNVVGPREILIDHAHWGGPSSNGGGVSRGVAVIDVSPANDWSEVRVSLGASGEYGNTYPVYGFIYNRPDNGIRMASGHAQPRQAAPAEEVAAAPAHAAPVSLRHGDETDVYKRNSQ